MSKYIIEIDDEPLWKQSAPYGKNILFKAKNFNALVFDKNGLNKLIPLDNELEEAYQKGLEEGKARNENGCVGCKYDNERIDHAPCIYCCNAYSNQWTAKEKPDEIKVGDEVKSLETGCTYIIHETDEKYVRGYNFKIRYTCYGEKNKFKKTGRHFPQVAELLKAMNGEQRNCSTCKYSGGSDLSKCSDCIYCSAKAYTEWEPKEGVE